MGKMKPVEIKIDKIIPYENNPRKNDKAVDAVANSIKQFGFKNPIILDKEFVIIAGHTRYKAAKQLQMDTVPCVIADDLSEEQAAAFRLADNRVASFSSWNEEKLREEITEIHNINLDDFGFEKEDVEKLFTEKEKRFHVCPKCGYKWS